MKNKLLIVLTIIAIVAVVPVNELYGRSSQENIGGELNSDISWRIENNTLYLSGKGVVPTTMLGAKSAWHKFRANFNSVVIENGISGLGQNLFVGYKNITSLTVAASVKDIAPSAFNSCKKLSVVEVKGATPPDISVSVFYKVKLRKAVKLIIPAGTRAAYEADPLWNKFGVIEESSQSADEQAAPAETLEKPFIVKLTRTTNFVGAGVDLRVFLNGVDWGELENGGTVTMETDRSKNVLYVAHGEDAVVVRRFDATPGGFANLEFSFFLGYIKIIEDSTEK